jgi:hypothetical protein
MVPSTHPIPSHSSPRPRTARRLLPTLLLLGIFSDLNPHRARPPESQLRPHPAASAVSPALPHRIHPGSQLPGPPPHPPFATDTASSAPQSPAGISFNGRLFGPDPAASETLARFQQRLEPGNTAVALLGVDSKPGRALRDTLATHGIQLLDYVPDDGWIARVSGTPEARPCPGVTCFQPLDAPLRVQPGLREHAAHRAEVSLYVHNLRDRPISGLRDALEGAGFRELTLLAVGDRAHLATTVPAHRFDAFLRIAAAHPDVQRIEAGGRPRLLNDSARQITQGGRDPGTTPFHDRGIHGLHQTIAVCDTGLDIDACFFREPGPGPGLPPVQSLAGSATDRSRRKVIAVSFLDASDSPEDPQAWDNHGHGTSVAGCAAGSSFEDPWNLESDHGMAPGAWLVIQDAGHAGGDACADLPGLGCPVTQFHPTLLQAVAMGATIHNNSWGDQESSLAPNGYTQACRELDLVTWSNRQFLVVCAAGNGGLNDTVGSPSTSKNCLSIAASLSGPGQDRIAGYSSRGWASDGRYKPDLAAPGDGLRTAASDGDVTTANCYRTRRSGTSFASPIVAGLAALVRDYFAQGFHPTGLPTADHQDHEVSAALVKAVLIHSAEPMSGAANPPPSRDQGWGRVNLSRTLPLAPRSHSLHAQDQPRPFTETPAPPHRVLLRLTSTQRPLRVTLVWTDYPAAPGADRHLVNDLDLRVRTQHRTLRGNPSNAHPSAPHDRLNNVEQIELMPETPGLVEVSVWAHRIVIGPQDFALVITGDFEELNPSSDTDADGLPDVWEEWHFGNLEASPSLDPDNDGLPNHAEWAADTDPRNPRSGAQLKWAGLDQGKPTFRIGAREGRSYTLERATGSLATPVWIAASAPVQPEGPVGDTEVRLTDGLGTDATPHAARLYRVRIQPLP